jgi:methionyl-tRNA formyltransferase
MTDQDARCPPLRIVYMGTPDFAVQPFRAIFESHHEVVGVLTQPDRPRGRGKKITPCPVKIAAEEAGLPVLQPSRIRSDADAAALFKVWRPDVAVVAAFGQILPAEILSLPRLGCINIHASLLPKYRGAAPIQWCLIHGDEQTGVTMMQMNEGLDTGAILCQRSIAIRAEDTAQSLHDRLSTLGAEMIVDTLDSLNAGALSATPQHDEDHTYAPRLRKEDGRIDWSKGAQDIVNLIRGTTPWPGAYSLLHQDGESHRIKFHACTAIDHDTKPGRITDRENGRLIIGCGHGSLRCDRLQAPGKRAMTIDDFLRGFRLTNDAYFL